MRDYLRALDKSLGKTVTRLLGAGENIRRRFGDSTSPSRTQPDNHAEIQRILAIKLVGLGDSVLVLTALDRIRKALPKAKIFVLATPLSKGILEGQPQIEGVISFDPLRGFKGVTSVFSLLPRLKKIHFDCIIDFEQHFQASAVLSYLVGAPTRIGLYYGENPRKMLLNHPVFLDPEIHMLESYFRLLEPIGIKYQQPEELVPIRVSDEDRKRVDSWLESANLGDDVVGIHAGSGIRAQGRRWAPEKFAELIKRLNQRGFKVVLTGSTDEYQMCETIRQMAGQGVFNCAGKFSIRQTAYLISKCSLFISNDTGPMHISAAMGTPTIGLFGPETPQRYRPIGKKNRVVFKNVACSPCIRAYMGIAPKCSNPICMESITVEDVWNEITQSGLIR